MLNTDIIDQHLTQLRRRSIVRIGIELPHTVSQARNGETKMHTRAKLSAYRSNLCTLESQTTQYLEIAERFEYEKSATLSPSVTLVNSDVLTSATTSHTRA